MIQRLAVVAVLAVALLLSAPRPGAAQAAAKPRDLQARLVTTPPKLDGVLDDEAWAMEPQALDPWMSYNP
ncbi:MAG TPA: hypothetical protein VN759_12700, partial [Pseudolysinimonas sp.]|nr:hypothetical protein [Pseudolysinimonas sp.]